jgi:hypothetical protein
MAQKRTTHKSRAGTKLYAKRSKTGQFTDIQTYKRAHGSDVKRRAESEGAPRTSGSTRTGHPCEGSDHDHGRRPSLAQRAADRSWSPYRDLDRHGPRAGDGPAEAAGRCDAAGADAAGGPEHPARVAKDAA